MSIELSDMSSLHPSDAEKLIGKKVVGFKGSEYSLTILFDDGIELTCEGHQYEDASLGVSINNKQVTQKD